MMYTHTSKPLGQRLLSAITLIAMIFGMTSFASPQTASAAPAADQYLTGSTVDGNLRILVRDTGTMNVWRYIGSSWQTQIYGPNAKGSRLYYDGSAYTLSKESTWVMNGTDPTLVSNSTTGNTITTVWNAGSDFQITQQTTYNDGNSYYRLEWNITNVSGAAINDLRFFHGEDTYLSGGDAAAGWWDAVNTTIGAQKDVSGVLQRMYLQGITTPYAYDSINYSTARNNANAGALSNTVNANVSTDNGYALEWREASLAVGATWTIVAFERFTSGASGSVYVIAPVSTDCSVGSSCDVAYQVSNPSGTAVDVNLSVTDDQPTWNAAITSHTNPATVPANGSISVVVQVSPPAGTANGTMGNFTLTATPTSGGSAASDTAAVQAISTAPAAPVITSPVTGTLTMDNTPTFTGTAEAGTITVTVSLQAGGAVCVATVQPDNSWSCTPTSSLPDGEHTFVAVADDGAGNESAPSDPVTITIDATAPAAPTVTAPISGTVTNDNTPTFEGTGEPGGEVNVYDDEGNVVCTITVNPDGTWSCTPSSPLDEGEQTYDVTVTDPAGNESDPTPVTITVDTTAPAAPTVTAPVSGTVTTDNTPTFEGTGEPGGTVIVYDDEGGVVCTTTVNPDGSWSCTPSTPLDNGEQTFEVTVTDEAGNESDPTPVTVTIAAEADIDVSVTELTSTQPPDVITTQTFEICNNGTLPLTYTISAGSVVGPLMVQYRPFGPQSPGTRDILALAGPQAITGINPIISEVGQISWSVDGLGTVSSGTIQVEKPAGAVVRNAYMAASSSPGQTTPDGAITINGSGVVWDPAYTVPALFNMTNTWADVTTIVKPIVDAAPAGLIDLNVVDGGNTNEAMALIVIFDDPNQTAMNTIVLMSGAQDPAGDTFNVGLAEPIDKSAPGFGIHMSLGISYGYQDGGAQQYSIVDVNSQRLTTSAGGSDDAAEVPDNGNLATVGGIGDSLDNPPDPYATPTNARSDDELYTLDNYVNNGDTSITVFTQNPSNDDNIFFVGFYFGATTASVGESILLTPVAPTPEVGEDVVLTAHVQDDAGDPIVGRDVTFTITSGPNAGQTHTVATDSNGNATFTYTSASEGTDTVQATADKTSGGTMTSNTVSVSWQPPSGPTWISTQPLTGTVAPGTCDTITVTFDSTGLAEGVYTGELVIDSNDPDSPTTIPVTLTVTGAAPLTVIAPISGTVTSDTPTFAGTGEPGYEVTVYDDDGNVVCTSTVDPDGFWTCVPGAPLDEGEHTFTVTQTDPWGNESDPVAVAFTVNTTPAVITPPIILSPADGAITNDNTPTFSGVADAGTTLTVTLEDGAFVCATTVAPDGTWACTPTVPLPDGEHTFVAVSGDGAGNESDPSAPVTLTIDTVAPAPPTVTAPISGTVTSDTPTFAGTGEPGFDITVYDDEGNVVCTTTVHPDGTWTCVPDAPLPDGEQTFEVTQKDRAGNESDPVEVTITVDTSPAVITPPIITAPISGTVTSDNMPIFEGIADAGTMLTVTLEDGTFVCATTVNPDGTWSCTPGAPLPDGEHTFVAVSGDGAGNESDPSDRVKITIDTVAPEPPVIITPSEGATTGPLPTFSGTAEPGSTVRVEEVVGTIVVVLCEAVTDAEGNWTCTATTPLSAGEHTARAIAVDAAGNESDPDQVTFTVAPVEAQDDTYDVPEGIGSTLDVLENDSSASGGDLTIIAVGAPAHGTATTDGDTVIYTPTVGYIGPDSFSYTINDGTSEDSALVTVTVLPVADLEVAQTVRATISGLEITLVARNLGPRPANGAVISDTFPSSLGAINWTCVAAEGAACPNASGTGHIEETLATFPAGGVVTYTVSAQILVSIIEYNTVTITPPAGTLDLNMANNSATRPTLYRLIFPIVFKNYTP